MLTLMTVDVGFAGQPFIEEVLDKIHEAKEWKEKYGYTYKIQIDGSCNISTFKRLSNAGAEVYVVGSSSLFGKKLDLKKSCMQLEKDFDEAVK